MLSKENKGWPHHPIKTGKRLAGYLYDRVKSACISMLAWFYQKRSGNHVVLLESTNGFDGNAGAVYQAMRSRAQCKNYIYVWFVMERKPFYPRNQRTYVFTHKGRSLRKSAFRKAATWILYDNIPIYPQSSTTKAIYLTHGEPGYKNARGMINTPAFVNNVLCTSENVLDLISYQYDFPKEKAFFCGHPRNDAFFKPADVSGLFEKGHYNKVVIWMPTFRKQAYSDRNDSDKSLPLGLPLIATEEDYHFLNSKLQEMNILLIIKLHQGQDLGAIKATAKSNIKLFSQDQIQSMQIALYSVFPYTDALLTDYSSVAFDYMLLDKPIGYVIDDLAEYKLGFMYDNVTQMMPGEKIQTIDELIAFFQHIQNNVDAFRTERNRVSAFANDFNDGRNCERVLKLLGIE